MSYLHRYKRLVEPMISKLSYELRSQKLQETIDVLQQGGVVLDVGAWVKFPEPNPQENWLEKQNPMKGTLIAVGIENMEAFKNKYPHVLCVQANGCALPFKSNSVDIAFANAVLEHVPEEYHVNFVTELATVSRKKSILTVPDRLSPIEIHTRIPFLHWLPWWRTLFAWIGEKYWASKENLATIFTYNSLRKLLHRSTGSKSWAIKRQFLWFIPISLIATYESIAKHTSSVKVSQTDNANPNH